MQVKEIYVEAAFTRNLGNYQNFKPTAGVRVELEPGEDEKKAFKKAWQMVGEEVFDQVRLFEEDSKGGVKKGL